MAWLVAASVIAVATPVRADGELPTIDSMFPGTVRVGEPSCRATVDRIAAEIRSAAISWITIEIGSKCSDISVPLEVPAGTRIVGMAVTHHGQRAWSAVRTPEAAREAFRREADAAVLAWDSTSADQDHLRMLVPGAARIELAVELPPLRKLGLHADGQRVARIEAQVEGQNRREWRNQRAPVALDVSAIEPHVADDAYLHAGANVWLVSGAPNRSEVPLETRLSRPPHWSADKTMIKRIMRWNTERFSYCYERVAQWNKGVEGTATLTFFIDTDGKIKNAVATGELPEAVNTCLAASIMEWSMDPMDGGVLVNYPLTFRMYD